MKFFLIVAKGKKAGFPIEVKVDLFTLGSESACQLRSQLPGIGGQHCALVMREKKVFCRDLNSGEATILNGSMIPPGEEYPIHAGDRLAVGPLEFLVQFREKVASQRDLEEWALRCLDKNAEHRAPLGEELTPVAKGGPMTPSEAAAAILGKLDSKRGQVVGRLRISKEGTVTLIRFSDNYLVEEAEIALVKKELQENLGRPNLRVLLDFKNIRRMSSAGVAMIEEVHSWLRPYGSTLALCRLRSELRSILDTLNMNQTIRHFDDKAVALSSRW